MYSRKAGIITVIFGINAIISVITQVIIASFFGLSAQLDDYLIAVTIPTILITILYASINDTFLPAYAKAHTEKKGSIVAGKWLTILFVLSVFVSCILYLVSWNLLNWGFTSTSKEALSYFHLMLFSIPLAAISALLMSIAYYENRFFAPPAAQVLGAVCNALCIVLLHNSMGAWALPVGFVVSIAVQLLLMLGFVSRIKLIFSGIEWKPILVLIAPVLLAAFLLRSDTWLMRRFSTQGGEGMVSAINYASRLFALTSGIITSGVAVLFTPLLSRAWAEKDMKRFAHVYKKGVLSMLLLATTTTVILVLLRQPLISALLVRGKFTAQDAVLVSQYMLWFIPAAIAWGVINGLFVPYVVVGKQTRGALFIALGLAAGIVVGAVSTLYYPAFAAPIAVDVMLVITCILLATLWKTATKFK